MQRSVPLVTTVTLHQLKWHSSVQRPNALTLIRDLTQTRDATATLKWHTDQLKWHSSVQRPNALTLRTDLDQRPHSNQRMPRPRPAQTASFSVPPWQTKSKHISESTGQHPNMQEASSEEPQAAEADQQASSEQPQAASSHAQASLASLLDQACPEQPPQSLVVAPQHSLVGEACVAVLSTGSLTGAAMPEACC